MDVLTHYGFAATPWEVCLTVAIPNAQSGGTEHKVGCTPSRGQNDIGGHVVARVNQTFLVDASFGQVSERSPSAALPPVLIGRMDTPLPGSVEAYRFVVNGTLIEYRDRTMERDWRTSPDWGPSAEREDAVSSIVRLIDNYFTTTGP